MPRKTSAESCMHPYMRAAFLTDPDNHFWEKEGEFIVDKNNHVDHVLESSPRAKEIFRESAARIVKERSKYRLHAL